MVICGGICIGLGAVAIGALAAGVIGGSNDSVNNNKVTNDVITNSLTSISNQLVNEIKQDVGANQVFKLKTGSITSSGAGSKCNISVDQKMGVNVHSVLQAVTELSNQQMQDLATSIANEQTAQIDQVNESFNLGQENSAEVNNDIRTNIENNMETILSNSIRNANITTVSAAQEQIVTLEDITCLEGGEVDLTFNQEMALDVISEQISDNAITNMQSVKSYTDVTNKQKTAISQLNKGVDPLASAMSSCSSCIISLIAIFGAGLIPMLLPSSEESEEFDDQLYEEMGGGGYKQNKKKKKIKRGGAAEAPSEKPKKRWPVIILCSLCALVLGYLIYAYQSTKPKNLCPEESECSKHWDEMMKISNYDIRKTKFIENCRMEHHFCKADIKDENGNVTCEKGEPGNKGKSGYDANGKPTFFGPRCETTCAYVNRRKSEGKPVSEFLEGGCDGK